MKIYEYIDYLSVKYGQSRMKSIRQFGEMCELSENTLHNYIYRGTKPSLKTLRKIIRGSDGKVTLDDLMGD